MNNFNNELINWKCQLDGYHIPRWDELPDIDLYMDQVVTLIEKYLAPFCVKDSSNIITASMINNYVKLGLIPPPVKKKYNKKHLAYLIAISFLKQVLTITQVRDGILQQSKIIGTKGAFNLFCDEQELSLSSILSKIDSQETLTPINKQISINNLALKSSTLAFANKILTEKIIDIHNSEEETK